MCAIDGGRVTEHLYAADLLAAVACTANGRYARTALDGPQAQWADLFTHTPDVDRIAGTAMAALELAVANTAPHQVRLLDGSFLTAAVEVRKGLSSTIPTVRDTVARLVRDYRLPETLSELLTGQERPVWALPKSETATIWRDLLARETGTLLPVTDRVLAAQVLEPGELLAPRPMSEWDNAFINPRSDASDEVKSASQSMNAALQAASAAAAEGRLVTTYFRPRRGVGVFRVEFTRPTASDQETAINAAALLDAETYAPHMMEPFAQWAVDKRAKEVSAGVRALRAAVQKQFTPDEQARWGALFASGYRTT